MDAFAQLRQLAGTQRLYRLRQESHAPRSPLGELMYLALPTVVQMASYTVMQFADALQLAWGAGDAAATAAGMAGFLVFCAMSLAFCALLQAPSGQMRICLAHVRTIARRFEERRTGQGPICAALAPRVR